MKQSRRGKKNSEKQGQKVGNRQSTMKLPTLCLGFFPEIWKFWKI
jgi:hypothetical protein